MLRALVFTILLAATLLGVNGCATVVGSTTSEPIELNPGKRTLGVKIDDSQIETIAEINLNKAHPKLKEAHIRVNSYNAVVLLIGQVPSNELRTRAGEVVNKINSVRQVHNELQVSEPSTFLTRTQDTWLTTKIKSKLLASRDVEGGRIKVNTESSVVYLMGLVSRAEANRVTDIVRHTSGVSKVVRVFEYID